MKKKYLKLKYKILKSEIELMQIINKQRLIETGGIFYTSKSFKVMMDELNKLKKKIK